MKFILGTKQEMSQVYRDDKVIPITLIKIDNCKITQVKDQEKDGYSAVQVGSGRKKNLTKSLRGHLKGESFRYLKEFRVENSDFKVGDTLSLESFIVGEKVKVSSVSKGKGFQGVVRRWGFGGHPTTHGTKDQVRMSGSIGATGPAHVFKGTRMGGQMGNKNFTVSNLEIIEVDSENGVLKVKGAVPGHRNSLLIVRGKGEMTILKPEATEVVEEIKDSVIPEEAIVENTEEIKEDTK